MNIFRKTLTIFSALVISGCTLATPFRGPGYEPGKGVIIKNQSTVMVGLTHVVFHDDRTHRPAFWTHVDNVEDSLTEQPGFVGYSKRNQLFGNEAWTMTVWSDEQSMEDFVLSKDHRTAMRKGMDAIKESRFARFAVNTEQIPLTWEKALQQLDKYERDY